eukprot:6196129-Pleurochrysis_carterae.AAC.2
MLAGSHLTVAFPRSSARVNTTNHAPTPTPSARLHRLSARLSHPDWPYARKIDEIRVPPVV